jgi:hypothetical protein
MNKPEILEAIDAHLNDADAKHSPVVVTILLALRDIYDAQEPVIAPSPPLVIDKDPVIAPSPPLVIDKDPVIAPSPPLVIDKEPVPNV